jgi:hypothetical protein
MGGCRPAAALSDAVSFLEIKKTDITPGSEEVILRFLIPVNPKLGRNSTDTSDRWRSIHVSGVLNLSKLNRAATSSLLVEQMMRLKNNGSSGGWSHKAIIIAVDTAP